MSALELILILLAVSGALQILARRWRLPHPVLLVLGGAGLALIPGLPSLNLNPELVFLVFVPPLLYRAAITTSLREFKAELWPIARLGVILVGVSIFAAAATAHGLTPEFTWAAAFALGAIVAPPDPIAATAVMRTLSAPPALVSILEGEGLVNDATSLVAYRVAVAAAVTGTFSPGRAFAGLLLTGAGGVAIGLLVGWVVGWVRRHIHGLPVVENTLSLMTPFVAYIPADAVGASGVLAVVAVGLYLGRRVPYVGSAATRVQAEAMWSVITFLLESLVFILVGLELPSAVRALHTHAPRQLLLYSVAVSGTLILVRLIWVWFSAYVPRMTARWLGITRRPIPPWRWVVLVGWAGMRGADSLVIALSLPRQFPARDLIIFLTFAVIFATLVLQGLTLRPLLGLLHLSSDDPTEREEAHARRVIAEAGLQRLEEVASRRNAPADIVRALREVEKDRLKQFAARDIRGHGTSDGEHRELPRGDGKQAERRSANSRELRLEMIDAERKALIELRDRGVISDDVMRRVMRDIDLETMLLEAEEDDAPESPYEIA
jgi:Na+/H+ antiporter